MKVKDLFEEEKIGFDFISNKFDVTAGYWRSVDKFINDNWNEDLANLTQKQAAWITKIVEDCAEKRIEG